MKGRRTLLTAAASAGIALVLAAGAWACTPHAGWIWFCTTANAGCADPGDTNHAKGSSALAYGQGLSTNTAYVIRYTAAVDPEIVCMESPTTLGTTSTDSNGVFSGASVTMPGLAGSWSACAVPNTPGGGLTTSSDHKNFATF